MSVSGTVAPQQGQSVGKAPFPWNRVATLLGPYVAIVSGALAAWLIQHVPGLHMNQTALASAITNAVAFAIGAAGTFAIQHKWLSGWQQWEKSLIDGAAPASPPNPSAPGLPPLIVNAAVAGQTNPPDSVRVLPDAQVELASIPSGDDQTAAPPRPETAVTPDAPGEAEPTAF